MLTHRLLGRGTQEDSSSQLDPQVSQVTGTGLAFSPKPLLQLMASLGQVQLEVQKKWRQWHLQEFPLRPVTLNNSFSNATSGPTHSTKASTSEPSRNTARASII